MELRGRTIEGLVTTQVWRELLSPIFAEAGLLKDIERTIQEREDMHIEHAEDIKEKRKQR